MVYGFLGLSLSGYLIAILILTQLTIASVTIFLHRHQSHMALKLHPIASHFFRFWLWLATGIKTKEWVSVHRKHHAKCETIEDPHSPKNWGLKTMLLRGAEVYRAGKTPDTIATYGIGTPDDWVEKNIYSKYDKLGIGLMLCIDLFLFGIPGLSIWALQMMWIPFWAGGVINGLGHCFGYRNFEPNDASTNVFPWGLLIGGEELHNNHHAFPASAKLSVKWWELDMGWFYIRLLQLFRLAEVKKVRPVLRLKKVKQSIDFEVVKLLINNRLQFLDEYSRKVILPTLKKERLHASNILIPNTASKLLTCSSSLLDRTNQQIVSDLLKSNLGLNLVCGFRESLQALWADNKTSQQDLVQALKKWISEAESSGNALLEKFANSIPYYTVN
ncbi:MAG: fatty acid desaturase [Legionellaceae bacterium]|nr:fatty acid desaturase [Legionellaceae bacterium]MBP9774534.1 fatty acid desaturase [Legionellaceae bacterium]